MSKKINSKIFQSNLLCLLEKMKNIPKFKDLNSVIILNGKEDENVRKIKTPAIQ